ncbi:MAG: ABC transporter permease [Caldilineaceae bacterium]|nr:ABC transporter permease [Caldilineaceae bacterium]MBP8123373.1 ABC transporter permease [Caldilineaceae bacterium]MBP9070981.1 ABC transporter permease [Caldilineaceae bacterium]
MTQEDLAATPAAGKDEPVLRIRSQRKRLIRTFMRNRAAVFGLVLVLIIVLLAAAAPLITSRDPMEQNARMRMQPPDSEYILGHDTFGRDVYARIVYAGRISLIVGVVSVLLGGATGTILGLAAGYSGGKTETVIMRFVDILMAFPSLLLGLTVLAVLGAGVGKMIIAIGLMLAPSFARVVHGAALTIKYNDYVEAARSIGSSNFRIIRSHVLPNLMGEIVVLGSLLTASAIRVEANLSFIGLGVSPPTPTWGNMIRDGVPNLINAPWLSIFPGLAILVTVLAFNLLGDGLRDVLDPKLQE